MVNPHFTILLPWFYHDVDYFTIKYYYTWPQVNLKKKNMFKERALCGLAEIGTSVAPWIPGHPRHSLIRLEDKSVVSKGAASPAVDFPVSTVDFPRFLAPKIHHHHPFSWDFFMICSRIALHVPIFYRYFQCIFPCWTDLFPPLSHHQCTKHQPSRLPRGALSALSAARLVTSQTVIHEAHDADAKVHADPGGEYPATVCNGKSRSCWKFPNSRFYSWGKHP